jgi:hypothetical protein
MATRKKKKDIIMSAEISESMEMPGTIGSAKLIFPNEPTVEKGSHLTVTTFPDGRTELKWDDAALLRDVREAIETYELSQLKPNVRAKATTRTKKLKSS